MNKLKFDSLKEASAKTYRSRLSKVSQYYGFNIYPDIPVEKWFDLDIYDEKLADKSESTKNGYLSSVRLAGLQDGSSNEYNLKLKAKLSKLKAHKRPVKNDETNSIPIEMIKKEYNFRSERLKYSPTETHLIFVFYLYPFIDSNCSVLRGDLATLVVGEHDSKNYYNSNENLIFLHDHKTLGRKDELTGEIIGPYVMFIPDNLRDILDSFIVNNKLKNGDLLLGGRSKQSVCATLSTKYFGIQDLRYTHAELFTGDKIRKLNADIEDCVRISREYGHSLRVHRSFYISQK